MLQYKQLAGARNAVVPGKGTMMSWKSEKEAFAKEILALLYENKMIRTFYRDKPDGWTLVSGLYSPLYIQLRPLVSFPKVFEKVCRAMSRMVQEEAPDINRVIGIAMAGVPIAAGMSLFGIPAGFTRKMDNVKSLESFKEAITRYGEHSMLEGELASGDRLALVDDLVTRFDSKLVAMEQVKYEVNKKGLSDVDVRTVLVVLDREQGGQEAAQKENLRLLSVIPFKTVGLPLLKGVMHPTEWDVINRYLEEPAAFQNLSEQELIAKLRA
jgi:orotate phosphoribosyltransferase